jgi:hypothetical protein
VTVTRVDYAVTFSETGLPTGTPWTVTVGSRSHTTTGTTTTFRSSNGSYAYTVSTGAGFAADPAAGSFTVAGSAVGTIAVPFGPAHAVTFRESGLPLSQGFQWTLSVVGQVPASSTTPAITVDLPDGTYAYVVSSSPTYPNYGGSSFTGYTPTPATGTFRVSGSPLSEAVQFRPTLWSVTFVESGLPHGSSWQVTVVSGAGTVSLSSTRPTITFQLVNGTYGYSITSVSGFITTPTGSFLLWGAPITVDITFVG